MTDRLLTPQQELFLALYTNPKSDTFSNALQSALKAGYAQEYAESITCKMPEWLSENLGDMRRLRKAEKNLEEVQNLPIIDEEGKVDVNLIDKRSKVDIFLAKALNKQKYSDRVEHTGANGESLKITFDNSFNKDEKTS
jgi:hypothetical protein